MPAGEVNEFVTIEPRLSLAADAAVTLMD